MSVVAASSHARRAEVGGLRITDVAYRAGFDTSRHVHEHDCVTLALRGQVAKELNTSERTLAGGAVAVTPAEMPHVDRFGPDGGRVLVIELLERPEALSGGTPRTEALRLPWLGRRLAAELAATDAAAPLALHAAALELLAIVGRAPTGPEPRAWLDDVVEYLHAHRFERVTLAELATVAGVHRTHLVRAFRARFGVSIGTYVRRDRVRWAADALRVSDAPIAEIALQAGFADQSHFTRVFAREMGLPPGRYRRSD